MSRIAALTAVLTMLVVPAAFAGSGDLRSPDARDLATPARVDLRSPDATVPVKAGPVLQDLRSPDAIDVSRPSAPAIHAAAPSNDGTISTWGYLAIVAAALAACVLLAVTVRRRHHVGSPVGV